MSALGIFGEGPLGAGGDNAFPIRRTATLTAASASHECSTSQDQDRRCGSWSTSRSAGPTWQSTALDFDEAASFEWASCLILPARVGRSKAIGLLKGALVAIIFKRLGSEGLSIVSMRPASRKERRLYEAR